MEEKIIDLRNENWRLRERLERFEEIDKQNKTTARYFQKMWEDEVANNKKNPLKIKAKEYYNELQELKEKNRLLNLESDRMKKEIEELRKELGRPTVQPTVGVRKITLEEFRSRQLQLRSTLPTFAGAASKEGAGPQPLQIDDCKAVHIAAPYGEIGPKNKPPSKPRGGKKQKLRDEVKRIKKDPTLTHSERTRALDVAMMNLIEACPKAKYNKKYQRHYNY